jgi:hypothetical protein
MTKITKKNVLALGVAGAITLGAASPTIALPLASNGEAVKQSAPAAATTEVRLRWAPPPPAIHTMATATATARTAITTARITARAIAITTPTMVAASTAGAVGAGSTAITNA